jgi:hypothetical protein
MIVRPMRPQLSGPEIDHAAGRVQEPRVAVPLVDRGGDAAIGKGEAFDGGDRFRARERLCELVFVAFRRSFATDAAREIEGEFRVVESPTDAIPLQPTPPRGDVPEIASVALGEAERERFVGKAGGLASSPVGGDVIAAAPTTGTSSRSLICECPPCCPLRARADAENAPSRA